jgi:hypothetical protein
MTVSTTEARARAQAFSNEWEGATDERSESQSFWNDFFYIFGLERRHYARFENRVKYDDGGNGFIDVFWPGKLICEQKSAGRSLDAAYKQALAYVDTLSNRDVPGHIIVSDFARMKVYDHDNDELREFTLDELADNIQLFDFIRLDNDALRWDQEQAEASVKACTELAKLHDLIEGAGYSGHKLEVFLVRLLFCFFAEDAGIFEKAQFSKYVYEHGEDHGADMGATISTVFEILNTPESERMTTIPQELKTLPYVNGGVFGEYIGHVGFNRDMRHAFWKCGQLDWKSISPSIFGSIFQGVMDATQRRSEGAHYTNEENIRKVMHPLFLDDLYAEFVKVKNDKPKLTQFHAKLSGLTFLDPACGCGNFLTTTYKELRHLEDQVLEILWNGQTVMDVGALVKVNVGQFYGIELLDFPCQIANVAIWLADHQANRRTGELFGTFYRHLPLKDYRQIIQANALTMDWRDLIKPEDCDFILGNPPFLGARTMNPDQKLEVKGIAHDIPKNFDLDYVSAWYLKAADFIQGTSASVAFVSTNSITQGVQVSALWKHLIEGKGVSIDFAHKTFVWDSEARGKAHVHCVIVGFSLAGKTRKFIFTPDGEKRRAKHINPYLVDAPDVFIEATTIPISPALPMVNGDQPRDGGHLVLSLEDRANILAAEPQLDKFIRPYLGAEELLNDGQRFCLWLEDASPAEIRSSPTLVERIALVRDFRLASRAATTQGYAATPSLFAQRPQPTNVDCLAIPSVSSERRAYIPIAFVAAGVILSNAVLLVPSAGPYDFGVLSSHMHNSWMRQVAGRLESRYRYGRDTVYNTFPWPSPDDEQRLRIEQAADEVLRRRRAFPGCSLADLYGPESMPPDLVKAHRALDKAVERAYGVHFDRDEDQIVAHLFEMYAALTA